jgi:putative membrane protein
MFYLKKMRSEKGVGMHMNLITKILSVLVAAEFLYIFYLETIATASTKTSKVFGMTKTELRQKNVNILFKNQGVYNGLIAVMILLAVFVFASKTAVVCLMAYIVAVALYGSLTSNPKIILMQGGLAILTLLFCIF